MRALCANCLQPCGPQYFVLSESDAEIIEAEPKLCSVLCSASCLVEVAWRLRESAPKLSKSKEIGCTN